MDGSLASMRDALAQIERQHANLAQHAARPAYFTNAVLRPQQLDILELIRDADALESTLFRPATREGAPLDAAPSAPRLTAAPSVAPIPVPAALQQPRTDDDDDARPFLEAAEQLLHN